jgi:hypothetical protein
MVAEVSNMCHANSLRNMMRGQIVPRQTSRWSQSPGGAIFLLSGEVGRSHQPVVMDIICYMAHIWPIYGPCMAFITTKTTLKLLPTSPISPGSSCLYGGTSQLHRTAGQEIRSLWTEMAIWWHLVESFFILFHVWTYSDLLKHFQSILDSLIIYIYIS